MMTSRPHSAIRRARATACVLATLGLVLAAIPAGASARVRAGGAASAAAAYVPQQLLVRFRPGASAADRAAANRAERAQEIRALRVPRVFLVQLPSGRDVTASAAAYQRRPDVEYAEPNFIDRPAATVPNDTSFNQLWALNNTGQSVDGTSGTADADVDAPEAWDLGTGNTSVTVGVADTGIAYDHPDLAANIWANPGESGGGKESNGVDDDANGRVDDVHGYDFAANDSDPRDDQDHGSHVAGTIGAVGNNGAGVAGVNWQVRIASLRICNPNPLVACSHAAQADAYAYAGQMGFKVVSASISGSGFGQTVADSIAGAPNTLFVFAAGNEATNNDQSARYPCQYPSANIVCVGASDQGDQLAWFSNYGATSVDLVAPGTNILSTIPFATRFEDGFEVDNFSAQWVTGGTNNTWSDACGVGNCVMTDSPTGNYRSNTNSWARTASPLDLSAMEDCRVQYLMYLDPRPGDVLRVETSTNAVTWTQVAAWPAATSGWEWFDHDVSFLDGQPSVYVRFRLTTDSSLNGDGVYLDEVVLRCFRASFGSSDYEYFQGTSMATPHVSGAAALLWAKSAGETVAGVKAALLEGVDAKPAFSGKTVSGGRLNLSRSLALVAGYARAKAATPLQLPLVPAYQPCSTPNRAHQAPLTMGSCNPPAQESGFLTAGTGDANGQASNSVGSVRYAAQAGNPSTPANEADVSLVFSLTDVRRRSDLSDYTGQVKVDSAVRITDRLNGSSQSQPATTVDLGFPMAVQCAATADTAIGATCAASTTFNAIVPGAIVEGKRAIWQMGQVAVHDGGADNLAATAPNTIFARQGIFVP
jgi:subtilisin family serine protease